MGLLIVAHCLKDECKSGDLMYCLAHVNGGYQKTLGKIQKITCKGQTNLLAQVEKVQVNNMKTQIIEYH